MNVFWFNPFMFTTSLITPAKIDCKYILWGYAIHTRRKHTPFENTENNATRGLTV